MQEKLFDRVRSRVGTNTPQNCQVKIPNDLMCKCPKCKYIDFMENFVSKGKVCPSCNYHLWLSAIQRLEMVVDHGSFIEWDNNLHGGNPIEYPGYMEKIELLQAETGMQEAILTGECKIEDTVCAIGIMDSRFMMASMGSVVGEKITLLFERATEQELPVIIFTASGGVRMQEGIISLMQMAKTSGAVCFHNTCGCLYIAVLTDPTAGGVAASFASLGDIILAEPKAYIGFVGRLEIEGAIRQKFTDDFQSAEFFLTHGFIDALVDRSDMRKTLGRLLRFHEKGGSCHE